MYHYKFLVNGCIWLEDSNADPKLRQPDGKGGFNSGVRVGPDPAEFGTVKPDDLIAAAIKHDPSFPAYFTPIGEGLFRVCVRTLANDAESVSLLRGGSASPSADDRLALARTESRDGFDSWCGTVSAGTASLRYAFEIIDGSAHCILGASGANSVQAGEPAAAKPDPFTAKMNMSFKTPDWAKRAVWYQIFPERFRNGDPANDPPRTVPWTHEWFKPYHPPSIRGKKPDFAENGDFHQFIFDRRYGGDLQGVREKLPYLRELGITAIYFNPVFQAESLHKYDASDYRHIDDFFGVKGSLARLKGEGVDPKTWQWSESDKVFLDFLKEAHAQGFKVILDGVFNHVGRDFWAFQDVLKNGEKSPYCGWFDIVSFKPFHYKAWDADDGALPRLKHDDALGLAKPVREHLFAVTRRWMDPNGDGDPSDGIDGWRLDVASDINANFWKDWRRLVKSINPDAYIVAELWEESKSWLDGQTFDAVMNYPFARATQRFFVNQKKASKPSEFVKELQDVLAWYAPQVNYVLQNLFDSHDTDRVASMFMNPDLEYDKANRLQDNGPNYNVKRPTPDCYEKMKLAVTMQMTYLGAPMVYYGDEVGMYGADDPSDRKPMLWEDLMPYDDPDEKILPDLREHYRRMIAIRNTYPALQVGSFEVLEAKDGQGVLAYSRTLDGKSVVVVLNNSDKAHRLDVPVKWGDGSRAVRLDDPASCEVVTPADAKARPTVRPIAGHKSGLKVEKGRLHGLMMPPRTGAVFAVQ